MSLRCFLYSGKNFHTPGAHLYIRVQDDIGRGTRYRTYWIGDSYIVDQKLQRLMKELGDAINESLSDSEQIAEVIAKIKSGGYDVFLVLEATIGFNKRDEQDSEHAAVVNGRKNDPDFKMNQQDVKFLKSLRISIDGDDKAA